jgi:pilus assembly protein TadC
MQLLHKKSNSITFIKLLLSMVVRLLMLSDQYWDTANIGFFRFIKGLYATFILVFRLYNKTDK